MASYEQIVIVGNLGGEPEMRYTQSGQAVTNFSVAVNKKWNGQDGQAHEQTKWFRVATWGKLAEVCNQYLSKGRQVLVEGEFTVDPQTGGPRVWTDQNGNSRASLEITASRVVFLGGNGGSNGSESPAGHPAEDEVPF